MPAFDPVFALDAQTPDDLVWIRDNFLDHAGLHSKVIVHGHTPHNEPEVHGQPRECRYAGLSASGVLTALVVDGIEKQFLTVRGSGR